MRILAIDDELLLLEGYKYLLRSIDSSVELITAKDHLSAENLVGDRKLDLILLDYHLGLDEDSGDMGPLIYLREKFPETMIVMVSGEDKYPVVKRAIDNGAAGYILKKNTDEDAFADALECVLQGEIYIPEEFLDPVDDEICKQITERQREILNKVAQGKGNKTIAKELDISDQTVKTHLAHVYKILNVNNRAKAVKVAAALGFQIGKLRATE